MSKNTLLELVIRENNSVRLASSSKQDLILTVRSEYRDEFEAKLGKIIQFLQKLKLGENEVYRITAIVGELGNNSFDHNLGKWPNGFIGNFVVLRYNETDKLLEIVVIDLGIGFQESLKQNDPAPKSEVEAIKLGLIGVSGRVRENRGNGLRTVVTWMKNYFQGKMQIQSNEGIIAVDKDGTKTLEEKKIIGTQLYLRLRL